jgi:ABC-type lipoprotein export system ATPase subunit
MVESGKQAIVRVERLSKYFGAGTARVNALVDINMEVYPGQVVGLMGPSGSGKTTLLNCIACILQPSSGPITLDGETVYADRWLKADLRRLRLDKIGFIFQYPNLLPFLDATDNVAWCCSLRDSLPRRLSRVRSNYWTTWKPAIADMRCRRSCPAARGSASRLLARSPTGHASSSLMSRTRR